jgi:hypothetical protein
MTPRYHVLVLGASYGSLLATKLLLAGHDTTLVCLPAEAELIEREGTRVRIPVRGREDAVLVDSRDLPGRLHAAPPAAVDPARFDLVALAMQEPQYGAPEVRALLAAVGAARRPCLSIMNMPPLPFLARVPGVDAGTCRDCYADATVWDVLDPGLVTLCSPDPQAFRPPDEPDNVLDVRLPTNFKAARFVSSAHTGMLRRLEADIEAARLGTGAGSIELPVKLRVHDSVFVPMAKWSMLLAGNYRCIGETEPRSIREAVHDDLEEAAVVYDWVARLCLTLGAAERDLVPFEKYARAAAALDRPSSAARAVFAGAARIERVDRVVQALGRQKGMRLDLLDEIVDCVDGHLERNAAAPV